MQELTDDQRELAALHRVATEYVDWQGSPAVVPAETVLAVLAALGVDARRPASAAAALSAYRHEQQTRALPPCIVARHGATIGIPLGHQAAQRVEAWIELEDGSRAEVTLAPANITGPADLPLGYHTVRVRWDGTDASCALIVTPTFLGFPDRLGDRGWGFATQLYSVRSHASWGVGDLADLGELAGWSGGELGADYILVNPLSAAEPVPRMEPSPYLPTSRRFVNPLYLRVEQVPEYADLAPSDRARIEALRTEVHETLDRLDAIDRDSAWAAKSAALRLLHAVPRSADRSGRLLRLRRARGDRASRLRHLVRVGGGARERLGDLAGRAPPPGPSGGRGVPGHPRLGGRLPRLAAVAARRAAPVRPGRRPRVRDGARHHA